MLQEKMLKLNVLASLLTLLTFAAIAVVPQTATAQKVRQEKQTQRLTQAFEQAAVEFNVPSEILKTIAYSETRFDNHNGEPSQDNGYGMMHLADNPNNQTLHQASAILGVPADVLKNDDVQNIRGGAAILSQLADLQGMTADQRQDLGSWFIVVALYSHSSNESLAKFYADELYKLLQTGFSEKSLDGEELFVAAREVEPKRGKYEWVESIDDGPRTASADYGPALWVPAHPGNYTVSNRESSYPINYVVIHVMQGSYAGSISWFQNPASNVSAHYMVRSRDGQVTQMVREKDVAYHAGNWTYNTQSIGIEHEGFVSQPSWFTDAMYRSSAAITRHVCNRYGIPKTRARIIGHNQVPGATHTDPGPNWNWSRYMDLVVGTPPPPPPPTWETVVDNNSSAFTASDNWGTSAYSTQKYGSNYRFANPAPVGDAAWFKATIPSAGNYEIYVWYPDDPGYNSSTPFVISSSSGARYVRVNQEANGGRWVSLGTHPLDSGNYGVVGVSRWTSTSGYVIADAVRIVRR